MDWNKFLAIATLAIFCADEISDYIKGENTDESTEDRIWSAMGAAGQMIDMLKDMKNMNEDG